MIWYSRQLLAHVDKYGDGDIVTPEVFQEYRWKIHNERMADNPVVSSLLGVT